MRHFRSVALALGALSFLGLVGACSAKTDGGRPGGSGASSGQTQGPQGGGPQGGNVSVGQGGALVFGSGGSNAGGVGQGGGPSGIAGDQCTATTTKAKLIPLDLYVLMDSSKSMLEATAAGGGTKWKAVTDAMNAFFGDPNTTDVNVALKYFPDEQPNIPAVCTTDADCAGGTCEQRKACVTKDTFSKMVTQLCTMDAECAATESCVAVQRCADGANCAKQYCMSGGTAAPCPADCTPFTGYCNNRDICMAPNYATPAVAFTGLPAGAPMLAQSFAGRTPDGFTPTGPALAGALTAAQARAAANPDHKVVVVLVTDGLPGGFIPNKPPPGCTPADIPGIGNVLAAGAMGTPPIPTFVIGVFGPCDLVDQNVKPKENLDTLAKSGGSSQAVVISTDSNVTQGLQDALKLVRTSSIACTYSIPPPPEGKLDFDKVNVRFASAATGNKTVFYIGSKDKCDPAAGGWYYDDPTKVKPTQIILCDQSCSSFQAQADGRVDIALGCVTEVPR